MLLPSKWNPSREQEFPGTALRYALLDHSTVDLVLGREQRCVCERRGGAGIGTWEGGEVPGDGGPLSHLEDHILRNGDRRRIWRQAGLPLTPSPCRNALLPWIEGRAGHHHHLLTHAEAHLHKTFGPQEEVFGRSQAGSGWRVGARHLGGRDKGHDPAFSDLETLLRLSEVALSSLETLAELTGNIMSDVAPTAPSRGKQWPVIWVVGWEPEEQDSQ